MLLTNFKRILVLCPHPDDETSCLGTLLRIIKESRGVEVKYTAFSTCEESVPEGFAVNAIKLECYSCLQYVGMKRKNIVVRDFPVRSLWFHRQEILECLISLRDKYKPDLVFCPSSQDTHQDHSTIYQEAFRAFKHSTMLGYEAPQNDREFSSTMFVGIPDPFMILKLTALRKYVTQNGRAYMSARSIIALGRVRGLQHGGCEYAESFETIRMVL